MAKRKGNLEMHVFSEKFIEVGDDTFRVAVISYISEDGTYYDPKIYLQRFEGKDRADNDRWSKVQAISLDFWPQVAEMLPALKSATADVQKLRAIPQRGSVTRDIAVQKEAVEQQDLQAMVAAAVATALAAALGNTPAAPAKPKGKGKGKPTPSVQ